MHIHQLYYFKIKQLGSKFALIPNVMCKYEVVILWEKMVNGNMYFPNANPWLKENFQIRTFLQAVLPQNWLDPIIITTWAGSGFSRGFWPSDGLWKSASSISSIYNDISYLKNSSVKVENFIILSVMQKNLKI